jgi:FkbM family methyltransferase
MIKYNWKGVMMEPQLKPYQKLAREYTEQQQLTILNAAISDKDGTAKLFVIGNDNVPEWAKSIASFSKQNILKHSYLIPGLEQMIYETEIKTISFQSLFDNYSIKELDLLQTDTEGYDASILRMFPFDIFKPAIIHFESKHISKDELERTLDLLIAKGYLIQRDGEEDMMAVLK